MSVGAAVITAASRAKDLSIRRAASRIPIKSIVPAALTPFTPDLQLDRAAFRRHLATLAAVPGVTAIMVNGAAGEDAALSRDERRTLVAEAVAAVGDRTPVIAAVRETKAIPDLGTLAKDAAAEGAHALLIMPPPNKDDLAWEGASARCQRVFNAANLPVAIYHVAYATETLVRLAGFAPVFAIKEGGGDPAAFARNLHAVRAARSDVAMWSTNSRWLLADLAVGADGILSGMGSITADLHAALAEAVWRSDLDAARRVNVRLLPLVGVFYRSGQNPHTRMKYALTRIGRLPYDVVRPPLQPLNATERATIDRVLRESGLLV